ncbi:MAG TPA: acyl-CoA synthetase [Candidatus Brocadiia bacterium]|nr:acyl-CoA synthetase [Candidatus Brocadiia bacterium]
MSRESVLPVLGLQGRGAAVVAGGRAFSYEDLRRSSAGAAQALLKGADDLNEARVAILAPPGFSYVAALWGVWRAGGVAVPLGVMHPPAEWSYTLEDSGADVIICHAEFEAALRPVAQGRRVLPADAWADAAAATLPALTPARRALMLYTSGTTSKPKGVVTTHGNIEAQARSLAEAWEWSARDRILHVLPLHHIHGVVNVLVCAMRAGAVCEFMPFEAEAVWERFSQGGLTLFMAVPTIYSRLAAAWDAAPAERRREWSRACRNMRLMVSGSAALPVSMLDRWRNISGHTLLERYGMTEIGMAISNPLRGERRPGSVGTPLPGVEVRLADETGSPPAEGQPGEIEVRGANVFLEYWRRPEATAAAFRDGWFRTGDVAVFENGAYRILGRASTDIIKTGGYKVSALETEEVLREHPAIAECAVVGAEDADWGERVCAAVVLKPGAALTLEELRAWAKQRLAAYKVPSRLAVTADLPRNAMGKVVKPEVKKLFEA